MATTRSTSADFIRVEEQYGAHNYHPLDVVIQRAEGVWVWDVEGNRYLDFLAAYSAVNQGHAHPRIAAALKEQAERVTLTSRAFRNDQLGPLYETVHQLTGYARMLPMNSGAEAVETAIKAARKWGYKVKGVPDGQAEILVFTGNFHGRTTTIVGFSDDPQYKDGFGPFTPGFTLLPYGDLDAARQAMNPNVVGILVEPIQGESGIIIPPDGYLKGLEDLCRQHRALLITDEIQSGLGRTGKMFAFQHENVRPDIVVIGKALQVLMDEKLIENSAHLGESFMGQLRSLKSDAIQEIRGRGLWIGLQLTPQAGGARKYCEALQAKGLLCKETHVDTIRFAPPLCIKQDDLDWAFQRVQQVFAELG